LEKSIHYLKGVFRQECWNGEGVLEEWEEKNGSHTHRNPEGSGGSSKGKGPDSKSVGRDHINNKVIIIKKGKSSSKTTTQRRRRSRKEKASDQREKKGFRIKIGILT